MIWGGHKNFFLLNAEEIERVAEETDIATEALIAKRKSVPKEAGKDASQPAKTLRPEHHHPPQKSIIIPVLIGLGVIFGLTYLMMRFAKKDEQNKSQT